MKFAHRRKVLVTGPPSSGTTAMTLLLHALGIDGGFNADELSSKQIAVKGKGLEYITGTTRRQLRQDRNSGQDNSPRLIKKPIVPVHENNASNGAILGGATTVLDRVQNFGWEIEHVVVTVRKFEDFLEAARLHDTHTRSRVRLKFADTRETERWVGYGFYRTIQQLEADETPYSVVEYPKFSANARYCFDKLQPMLTCSFEEFERVHFELMSPDKAHVVDGKVNSATWWADASGLSAQYGRDGLSSKEGD
jgi:hypothetical protein